MTGLIESGFRARVVAIKDKCLSKDLLGREIDVNTLRDLAISGIDVAGEAGEYHTVVTSCPMFNKAIRMVGGEVVLRDGIWFIDMQLSGHRPNASTT